MIEIALRHRLPGLDLDVEIAASDGVTALFGRSGAGKTTVINAIAGLLRPDWGRVVLGGRVLTDIDAGIHLPVPARRVGYVFQDSRLFPHLTVRGNLRFGAGATGGVDPHAEARVVALLGLGPLLKRRIGALSGGEARRVAIGRALLARPEVLLLDEPLTGLDGGRKAEVMADLERLRDESGVPMVLVSHDVSEVARLATNVAVMEAGRVLRQGPVAEVLADPEAVPALGPRDAGALLAGRVVAHHADGLTEVEVSGGRLLLPRLQSDVGASLRVRIAAQDVLLATVRPEAVSALNILPATVTALRSGLGPGTAVQLRLGADLLLARVTTRSATALGLAPGRDVFAILKSVSVAKADIGGGP